MSVVEKEQTQDIPEIPEVPEAREAVWLEIPELGVSFRRFRSRDYFKYVCGWRNAAHSRVYELEVKRLGSACTAAAYSDGRELFRLMADSLDLARRCGLAAMRAYLIRGHRKTWRKAQAARKAARGGEG